MLVSLRALPAWVGGGLLADLHRASPSAACAPAASVSASSCPGRRGRVGARSVVRAVLGVLWRDGLCVLAMPRGSHVVCASGHLSHWIQQVKEKETDTPRKTPGGGHATQQHSPHSDSWRLYQLAECCPLLLGFCPARFYLAFRTRSSGVIPTRGRRVLATSASACVARSQARLHPRAASRACRRRSLLVHVVGAGRRRRRSGFSSEMTMTSSVPIVGLRKDLETGRGRASALAGAAHAHVRARAQRARTPRGVGVGAAGA